MELLIEIRKQLRDPFKFIALFSLLFGILSKLNLGFWQSILAAIFAAFLTVLLLILIIRLFNWISSFSRIKFYQNWEEADRKYTIDDTLQYLSEHALHLEIVGRTCFQWLCGKEEVFNSRNDEVFSQEAENQRKKIIKAVRNGSTIHFILQNPNIPVPFFKKEDNLRLRLHARAAINSYDTLRSILAETNSSQAVRLSLTNEIVDNSMVRLSENSRVLRLIFDLNIKFKSSRLKPGEKLFEPFLVIESNSKPIHEFREEFNFILSTAMAIEVFNEQKRKGMDAVDALIMEYPHASKLRKDDSRKMAFVAAQDFLYDTNSPVIEKRPPPISIQLLITNQCTTQCKMCNHFSLYNRDNELTHLELLHTLDCISNLGTRSIIISGGEPLSYPTLPELLQYGKDKGLIIGLLTNGIMTGGNPIDNRHAKTILKTCEWVQLSIDSFEDSVYTTIRGKDLLNVALESLNRLMGVGFTNLELCFTIQKDNIHEVPAIVRQIPAVIPPIIPIRFKFGHGPNNRRGFLCSSHDIQSLIRQLPNNSERTNSDYLLSMIRNNYFDYDGISNGMPLQNTMSRYRLLGYQCKALNLSCKIDANGDVYPCCFLFDDNRGVSTIRPQYKLGSIRNPRTGTVLSPSQNGGVNALNEILNNNERLQQLQHKILPIDNEACSTCTRHFYQNEFLNKVSLIYYNCHNFGVAESIFNNRRDEDGDPFWV